MICNLRITETGKVPSKRLHRGDRLTIDFYHKKVISHLYLADFQIAVVYYIVSSYLHSLGWSHPVQMGMSVLSEDNEPFLGLDTEM